MYNKKEADLELILFDDALGDVLFHLMEDSQHGNVRLSCSGWCTDQQVLICFVCCVKHNRLNTVQSFGVFEGQLSNLKQKIIEYDFNVNGYGSGILYAGLYVFLIY